MADNVAVTEGAGKTIATDDIQVDGTHIQGQVQFVKLVDGTLNGTASVAVDVGIKANALRVAPANNITDATYIGDIKFGESLPAGTNAIGKLAANTGIDIGDVDVLSIAAGDNNIGNVDIVTMPSDTFAADAQAYGKGVLCQGDDGTDRRAILVGTDGHVQVDVLSGGGGTEYTEDVATSATIVGLAIMIERDDTIATLTPIEGDWASLRCSAEGALWVQDFNSDATLALLGTIDTDTGVIAGDTTSIDGKITACNTDAVVVSSGTITANLGATDNAVLDQIELNTDPLLVVGGGAEATAIRVTIANNSTGLVSIDDGGGEITVDGTITANLSATDNAVLDTIDAVLDTIDADTGAIKLATEIIDDWDATHAAAAPADGVQIMGAGYSAGLPTDIGADADAARICTDRHGRILIGVMPQNFQATFTSADAQAAAPVKAKTAARKMYILSLVVSVDTAMNVQFQDDTGPTVLIEGMYFAANGGAHLTWPAEAPLVVNTNEDFDVITSAAGNISVTITGYLAI